jgi:hypothetical protein
LSSNAKRGNYHSEEVGQPELMPFRQWGKGTEQTGTLSESARPGIGQPADRQSLYGIGLIRQERDGGSRAVATARMANDMAARLRSGKHVEEMRLPCGRSAPTRRSAKDSEKTRKGDGADCDFFGGPKRCKFRLTRFLPGFSPVSPVQADPVSPRFLLALSCQGRAPGS